MERVIVTPRNVRGLGNVVSPKTKDDFVGYNTKVTSSTDSNYGTVYTNSYLSGSYLTVTSGNLISVDDTSFSVTCVLKDNTDNVISSATVYCTGDGISQSTTTNSSGVASFTIDTTGESVYNLRLVYKGTNSVGGCFIDTRVFCADLSSLTLFGNKSTIQVGDIAYLIATLTDADGRGVPGQQIELYEEYIPTTLSLSSPNPIVIGDEINITAVLKDADGSGIVGETVDVYAYMPDIDELSVVPTKSIISKAHNQSTILIVTATYEGVGVEGLTVKVYKDGVLYRTKTTNSNGQIDIAPSYLADGMGDVVFTVECGGLRETVVIEDCLYYQADEVSYDSLYPSGDHSIRMDDNLSIPITSDFELSMDCKATMDGARFQLSSIGWASSTTSNYGFGFNRDGSGINAYYRTTSSNAWGSAISSDANYHNVKFVRSGDTFTAYLDNTSKGTQTFTWWDDKSPYSFYWWVWKTGTVTAKNIKLKKI